MDSADIQKLPLRAMTRSLAEMQTSIMARALPKFGGSTDRFMVYALLLNLTLRRGGGPTPILSLSQSLSLAFETARRHLIHLERAGLCARQRGGAVATDAWREDDEIHALAVFAHDCLVRFIEDMQAVGAWGDGARRERAYEWTGGLRTAIDLMLAVADANRHAHADGTELVLFSTVLCANSRLITSDLPLSRQYATPVHDVPARLIRPVSAGAVARLLALPRSTVSRRLRAMTGRSLVKVAGGYVISAAWLVEHHALRTSATSFASVRRLLTALEGQGFPFDAPASAYLRSRPALVSLG